MSLDLGRPAGDGDRQRGQLAADRKVTAIAPTAPRPAPTAASSRIP
jgi:hypothetical protein